MNKVKIKNENAVVIQNEVVGQLNDIDSKLNGMGTRFGINLFLNEGVQTPDILNFVKKTIV